MEKEEEEEMHINFAFAFALLINVTINWRDKILSHYPHDIVLPKTNIPHCLVSVT